MRDNMKINTSYGNVNLPWLILDKITDDLGFEIEYCTGCSEWWPANAVDDVPLPYCDDGCTYDRCKECQEFGDKR